MQPERRTLDDAELTPLHLHRRITDLESHAQSMDAWRVTIEENTAIQLEVVEVGKAIVKGMSWIKTIVVWIGVVGGAIAGTVIAIKKTLDVL